MTGLAQHVWVTIHCGHPVPFSQKRRTERACATADIEDTLDFCQFLNMQFDLLAAAAKLVKQPVVSRGIANTPSLGCNRRI